MRKLRHLQCVSKLDTKRPNLIFERNAANWSIAQSLGNEEKVQKGTQLLHRHQTTASPTRNLVQNVCTIFTISSIQRWF